MFLVLECFEGGAGGAACPLLTLNIILEGPISKPDDAYIFFPG